MFNPNWGVPEVVNIFVAAGTLAMAIYARKSIIAAKHSIEASNRSARATEESVQRMKDSLMPYFAVDISGTTGGVFIYVRNIGAGLGKIRFISIRSDLRLEAVWNEPIKYWVGRSDSFEFARGNIRLLDFTIGSDEEYSFIIPRSTDFTVDSKYNWLSSISFYYEDVYGRLYVSRLMYLYQPINETCNISSIGAENWSINRFPLELNRTFDLQLVQELEGSRPHIFRSEFRAYYRFLNLQKMKNSLLEGTEFTGMKKVFIQDIFVPWHGFPEFKIQIDSNLPFQITCFPKGEHGFLNYQIKEATDNKIFNRLDFQYSTRSYKEYGLDPNGNDGEDIKCLYDKIRDGLLSNMNEK